MTTRDDKPRTQNHHDHARSQPCIPITDFAYDPDTRKFRYLPTGQLWKRAGVDVCVAPVRHQGVTMKATEWLAQQGARR